MRPPSRASLLSLPSPCARPRAQPDAPACAPVPCGAGRHARAAPVQPAPRQPPSCAKPVSAATSGGRATHRAARRHTGAARPCRRRPTVERLSQIHPSAVWSNRTVHHRGCRAATAWVTTVGEASPRPATRHRNGTARTPAHCRHRWEVAPLRVSSQHPRRKQWYSMCSLLGTALFAPVPPSRVHCTQLGFSRAHWVPVRAEIERGVQYVPPRECWAGPLMAMRPLL